jgi:hypothetical protein
MNALELQVLMVASGASEIAVTRFVPDLGLSQPASSPKSPPATAETFPAGHPAQKRI